MNKLYIYIKKIFHTFYEMIHYYLFNHKKSDLQLNMFQEIKILLDDNYNRAKKGDVWLCYFDINNNELINKSIDINNQLQLFNFLGENNAICYVNYRIQTGQIGLINVYNYKQRGLAKCMLSKVINDLQLHHIPSIWCVATKKNLFWANVFHKSFKFYNRPHVSVTGSGYAFHILNNE